MRPAPRPFAASGHVDTRDDEPARLRALHALGVLDGPAEPRLQVLVDRAARSFRVPFAALAFVDAERVRLKASVGFDHHELPRGIAFCSHVVRMQSLLVVHDTQRDARFARSPLVVGAPHLRFYAGAPLSVASGHVVGSLCILDVVPRVLDASDRQHLEHLARYAADELMVRQFVGA